MRGGGGGGGLGWGGLLGVGGGGWRSVVVDVGTCCAVGNLLSAYV